MSVKYTCPDCDSVLRPAKPVAPGKKIKCPECGCVFAPAAAPASKAAAAPKEAARASKSAPKQDDDLAGYSVQEEKSTGKEDNKPLHFGSLRDKYHKSKRGPAMAKVVQPANRIMLMGAILCVIAVVGAVWAIFPMVFTEKALPSDRMKTQFLYLGGAILAFAWGATVCTGASKMQYLESYKWAMTASIMAIPLLLIGIMGIIVLRDETVMEGFEEGIPPER